jgi:Mg2+-importing ATPase
MRPNEQDEEVVGLTPEMLPMIVSVCLSKGALAMSRKKVIVKR